MQYIGVDPGKTGSVAVIDTTANTVGYCKLDNTEQDIWSWLNDSINMLSACAMIEQVHAMPEQGVSSTFSFGKSYGFLIGILTAIQIPYEFVTPQKWQKAMNCRTGGDKNVSKAAAQRLWPTIKITHANADALLIAEYGRLHVWQ